MVITVIWLDKSKPAYRLLANPKTIESVGRSGAVPAEILVEGLAHIPVRPEISCPDDCFFVLSQSARSKWKEWSNRPMH